MGIAVAPGQFETVGVGLGDDAVLVAVDGESHGRARRDGIEPVQVAQLVLVDEGLHVVVEAHGPEGGQSLVLGLVRVA